MNDKKQLELIPLSKLSRILFILASIVLFLENVFLIVGFPLGVLVIFFFPIDALAFFLFGIILILEFYLNRLTNCNDFIYTGLIFIGWSILTVAWRLLLPDWALGGGNTGEGLQHSLIVFLLASIWLTIALWKFMNLLVTQTEEGKAIHILQPKLEKFFQTITKLYIQLHQIFSVVVVIGFGIGQNDFSMLGLLGKSIIVPILGIFVYGLLTVTYMNHRIADVKKVTFFNRSINS